MKVWFVSHSVLGGGAERSLVETASGLRERGADCRVVVPGPGPLLDLLHGAGVPAETLASKTWVALPDRARWRRWMRLPWNLGAGAVLAGRLRRERVDVVYTNTIATCVGALGARLASIPHVWHLREYGHEHSGVAFDLGERRSLDIVRRWSARYVFNSRAVAERYRGALGDGRGRVVYQGVGVPDITGAPEPKAPGAFRVVTVGAISPGKRQEDAVRAVAELRGRGIDAELVVVGSGDRSYEADLRSLATELGIADRVRFTGFVADPYPWIDSADAVAVCSLFEGFGRVTVEAQLRGKVVVGADSGGTPEILDHGETGYLVPPRDATAFADVLAAIHADPVAAAALGERGRRAASDRFDPGRYAREIEEVVTEAAATSGPGT